MGLFVAGQIAVNLAVSENQERQLAISSGLARKKCERGNDNFIAAGWWGNKICPTRRWSGEFHLINGRDVAQALPPQQFVDLTRKFCIQMSDAFAQGLVWIGGL